MDFIERLDKIIDDNKDPRVSHWLILRTFKIPLITIACYLLFILWLGPRFMQNRKPYKLTNILFVYNLIQIVFNAWIFLMAWDAGWGGHYSFICQPFDFSDNPFSRKMPFVGWWYFTFKMVDLFDTIFFVLRKKYNQITFLHVYHHASMVIYIWIGLKMWNNGHGTFFAFINVFVHVVMYTYYLLAGLGKRFKSILWWKKYVTLLQLVQFFAVFLHATQLYFVDCSYPKGLAHFTVIHAILYLYLFSTFYRKSYTARNLKDNEKVE